MFIECQHPLTIGAEVTLRFTVPTQPEWIEVGGDVRWVVPRIEGSNGVGLGVRFQGLRARDVWALNRFFLSND
jgi:Tfp pilus assembly protein PilZ